MLGVIYLIFFLSEKASKIDNMVILLHFYSY